MEPVLIAAKRLAEMHPRGDTRRHEPHENAGRTSCDPRQSHPREGEHDYGVEGFEG